MPQMLRDHLEEHRSDAAPMTIALLHELQLALQH